MIICAAIKVQVEGLNHETIIPCHRHSDAFQLLKDLNFGAENKCKKIAEGFISSDGFFYDSEEAFKYVLHHGQLSKVVRDQKLARNDTKLYSEDLY